MERSLRARGRDEAQPPDWCYVNNFDDPSKPRAIRFAPGRASTFRRDLAQLVEDLKSAIPAAFEDDTRRSAEAERQFARFVAAIAHHQALLPLERAAVAAVADFSAREADDAARLSLHGQTLTDLLIEADAHARNSGAAVLAAEHVLAAAQARRRRGERIKTQIGEPVPKHLVEEHARHIWYRPATPQRRTRGNPECGKVSGASPAEGESHEFTVPLALLQLPANQQSK